MSLSGQPETRKGVNKAMKNDVFYTKSERKLDNAVKKAEEREKKKNLESIRKNLANMFPEWSDQEIKVRAEALLA